MAGTLSAFFPSLQDAGLRLVGLNGREGISQLFDFHLDLVSEFSGVPPEKLIGQNAVITITDDDGKPRYVNGYINRFVQLDSTLRETRYWAQVVPWIYFLTKSSNSRIFQEMTVFDIVSEVLRDQPRPPSQGSAYLQKLSGRTDFEKRSYCVQYRETDFNFISRLMEEEGYYYYFEHKLDSHVLVVGSAPQPHPDCPETSEMHFEHGVSARSAGNLITAFHVGLEFVSGRCSLTAYNYMKPADNFPAASPTVIKVGGNEKYEIYDHPGEYAKGLVGRSPGEDESNVGKTHSQGNTMLQVRLQTEEARYMTGTGFSTAPAITSGHKFKLKDFPSHDFPAGAGDFNAEYLITAVNHTGYDAGAFAGEGRRFSYSNSFTCIPASVPFGPLRLTPKPVVPGPQTATVTGSGDIYTDKYGRVQVQFYWRDATTRRPKSISCWVRVAESWASKGFGSQFLPRVGDEVVVAFLEGDPDQPLVIGRVYNATNMPPFELPANQTQSGIKTRSSPGGGSQNANELRFEDKKGKEEVFLHAERQLTTEVEQDESRTVGGGRQTSIGANDELKIQGNWDVKVQGNTKVDTMGNCTIQSNGSMQVKGMASLTAESPAPVTVKSGSMVTIQAPMIKLAAPIVIADGMIQCQVLQTQAVISPSYTPGAGNIL